jgi:hypothetical protein
MSIVMDDRSAPIWGVGITFFAVSWVAVGLRIWVRAGMIKSFGADDWTMVGTQLLNTAYLACQLGGLIYGTGRHMEDLEPARASIALNVWQGIRQASPIPTNPHSSTGSSARFSMYSQLRFSKSASASFCSE